MRKHAITTSVAIVTALAFALPVRAAWQEIDRAWKKMGKAAREQACNTLQTLLQRVQVAEWYGGLQNGIAIAWENMKRDSRKPTNP